MAHELDKIDDVTRPHVFAETRPTESNDLVNGRGSATPSTDLTQAFKRKEQGKPLIAKEYLQLNYGINATSWKLDAL